VNLADAKLQQKLQDRIPALPLLQQVRAESFPAMVDLKQVQPLGEVHAEYAEYFLGRNVMTVLV
jgi:hypothetical protein